MVGLLFVDEAGRLLAVDTFKKLPMKKHILHVQLVHRPVVRGGEVKDCPNHGGFDDRGECLIEVDPQSLVEAVDDPSCLATREGAIRKKLVLKHPFAGDNTGAWRSWNKGPCLVGLQSVKLGPHDITPLGVLKGHADG
jgi:hypothetical protein